MLDADNVTPHGVEVLDPSTLGRDELLAAKHDAASTSTPSWPCAAARELGITEASCRRSSRSSSPTTCAANGLELTVDDDEFVQRRRVKTAAELDGIRRAQKAADAAMGVAATLIRELRAGLTSEDVRAAMSAVCRGARLRAAGRGDRLPRRAVGARARVRSRRDPRGRAGDRRHLAARPRVALLRRHDAHVRRGRRRAAAGARGVLEVDEGLAGSRLRRHPRGRQRPRAVRALGASRTSRRASRRS